MQKAIMSTYCYNVTSYFHKHFYWKIMACYCFPKDPNNFAILIKTHLCQQARLHYFADKMLKLINVNHQNFLIRKVYKAYKNDVNDFL